MSRPTLDTTTQTPWLLTVAEVAQISRKSVPAVRQAIRRGQLEVYKQQGRRGPILTSRAAVADWLCVPVEDVRFACSAQTPGDDDLSAA